MFRSIGAALGQPILTHDRQPVRRQSRLVGHCEAQLWRRTDRQELRRIVLAARRFDLAGRAPGRRNGPLGHVALECLDLMAALMDRRTGRLEPSIAWLMNRLRRSRDAIVRALAALRAHGFLDWVRRFEPTGIEGRGPQVRQVSNAYRLALPPCAARLLARPVPLPDDLAHDLDRQRQERAAYLASLHSADFAAHVIDDDRLGGLLAQLGRRLGEREFAGQGESQTKRI